MDNECMKQTNASSSSTHDKATAGRGGQGAHMEFMNQNKKCNYAQACSVLIHISMTERKKDTKLFCAPGITQSLCE